MAKRITCWIFLLLCVGAVCLVVVVTKDPSPKTFYRADGSSVKVVAVTYGSNQSVVLGSSIQRVYYSLLPKKFKKWANVSAHVFNTTDPITPNFWLLETNQNDYLHVRPMDEYGCEFDRAGYAMSQESVVFKNRNFDGQRIFRYQFMGSHPNGKIIGLAVYDPKTPGKKLADIFAPGALLKEVPALKSSPGLVARQDGITFELKEFATGLKSVPFDWTFKVTNGDCFTEFAFQVTTNSEPMEGWSVASMTILDSHGAQVPIWNRKFNCGYKHGGPAYDLQGLLDPALGPYKLNVNFQNSSTNRVVHFEATPTSSGLEI